MGKTQYIDDIILNNNSLIGEVFYSPYSHAEILNIDISEALKIDGVEAIVTAKDIPGINNMGSVFKDEPVLVEKECMYIGHVIGLIAAKTKEAAKLAKSAIKIEYKELKPLLNIDESFEKADFPFKPYHIENGDTAEGFAESDYILEDCVEIVGQEHFYLETQGAVVYAPENGLIKIKASTQNPTEVQLLVSEVLGLPTSLIEVETSYLGGAFGGKETNGCWCSIWGALLMHYTHKNIKFVLSRDEDMLITGKRHPVKAYYKMGFSKNGIIKAYEGRYLFNMGYCCDLTHSIIERACLHAENAYNIPSLKIDLYPCKTNTASNTAFRGFGAPQGIFIIETAIEKIAYHLRKDPQIIRSKNYYGINKNNITPYGQKVKDNCSKKIHTELLLKSDYNNRKKKIERFNIENKWLKRGIGACPLKFGISFTSSFLNQGAALVNIYRDGSLIIHQGGIEMGQGLFDKIKKIAHQELGIKEEKIKIYNTNTSIIPNTSATAASTGSDINGQATLIAIRKLKKRLDKFAKTVDKKLSFEELVEMAYLNQINLSEKGFYKTPGLYLDRDKMKGNPFYYYVFGMAISEVEVDLLTGDTKILRTDILHDTGLSLDETIDKGQIEGAFVQSTGWCSMEELLWNEKGYPIAANADCYKVPGVNDIPEIFNVNLYQDNPFKDGILSSRAIGEPPYIYGFSVIFAIKNAISLYGNISLNLPTTKEKILLINN